MKFAHLADCHIGSWRDPKLKDISTKAFVKAIDTCIEEEVDFILIAGDLFNTPLPAIDNLKVTVQKLKELEQKGIPVYIVAGSHDFSPSGKTIIDVLEEAGLLINVVDAKMIGDKLKLKFTVDKKTNAKITGMLGKKGTLEKNYFDSLILEDLEKEEGYKIFIFHTAITEFKPDDLKNIESAPLSLLPKNFNYYAGGHVHYIFDKEEPGYGLITYPGPLFPNNFLELEKFERGGFYIIDVDDEFNSKLRWNPIQIYNIEKISIDCNNLTPEQIEEEIKDQIKNKEFNNTIVLLRLSGILSGGKPHDINFKDIYETIYNKAAYFVMRNTNQLTTKEFQEVKIDMKSVEDVEENIIKEHLGKIKVEDMDANKEFTLTKDLMKILGMDKGEMSKTDYENRVKEDTSKILGVD